MTENASGYSGGAFAYQVASKAAYDSYGRVTASYDANGSKTTTAYTMNSAGLTTGTTVTNALGQATSATLDPQRGQPLTSADLNGVVTTTQYDALGRVTGVWLASRATTSPANYAYAYTVSDTGVTAVTTQKLNKESGYQTSVVIDDALLRPRQTQTITPQGGRMVTDTFYDSRGWISAKYGSWWDSATLPNTTLVTAANLHDQVPAQDYYTYDGLGRVVVDDSENGNVVVSATTTVYNGDRTTVIPPAGGVTTSTVTDPLGRTTELDQYTAAPVLSTPADTFTGIYSVTGGSYTATTYGYDGHGNQAIISSGGRTWTSAYNLLGQATSKTDPDAGTSALTYDGDGNLTQSVNGDGKTISYTYDALSRKTGEYDAPVASQSPASELDSWSYDNSDNAVPGMTDPVGQLTTQTAYWNGAAYTTQAKGFTVFGESAGETVTIPSAEGALAGTYTFAHTYDPVTGLPVTDTNPAGGGLPAGTVSHGYGTALDLPATLGEGLTAFASGVTYDAWGRPGQETLGAGTSLGYLSDTYDPHTGQLTGQLVTAATAGNVDEQAYTYDLAGNITRQVSTRLGSAATSETQCYAYDQLDRLSMAWTATDSCTATPTAGNSGTVGDSLSAASAYWTSWSYDALGNQASQDQHPAGSGTGTTTTYSYGSSGTQPDTLTGTAATGGSTASTTYGYDAAGNMTSGTPGRAPSICTGTTPGSSPPSPGPPPAPAPSSTPQTAASSWTPSLAPPPSTCPASRSP